MIISHSECAVFKELLEGNVVNQLAIRELGNPTKSVLFIQSAPTLIIKSNEGFPPERKNPSKNSSTVSVPK